MLLLNYASDSEQNWGRHGENGGQDGESGGGGSQSARTESGPSNSFLHSKDNEEDGKHASFNFANVYNERARDLLGKEINVFWKFFDGPY
jgi:hypothetical protein